MINKNRLVQTFIDYISINSESGHEKAIADRLIKDLEKLGLEVHHDEAGKKVGSDGYNIYARLKGDMPGDPIIYSSHMDTVVPGNDIKPHIDGDVISTDGTTVLGGDDKSGIASIMEALNTIIENKLSHPTIEISFTIGEESGMLGAKELDHNWFHGKKSLVLDSSGSIGKIVTACPGQIKISATIIGRASHAGIAPEKGISAIQTAAKGVAKMHLLRIDDETTCNIGTFKCEGATNIVPAKAELIAEVRSRNINKLNAQAEHMKACLQDACDESGATLQCNFDTNYISFHTPDDDPLVKKIIASYESMGIQAHTEAGGGGSDANVLTQYGITSAIVSTGMTDVHTIKESLKISDLEKSALFTLKMMTSK